MAPRHSKSEAFPEYAAFCKARDSKDYEKAHDLLDPHVAEELGQALYLLGEMYEYGEGVTESVENAIALYERSAATGYLPAQKILGFLYSRDDIPGGVNLVLSAKWFDEAAKTHDDQSVAEYAIRLVDGRGVKQNIEQGVELLRSVSGFSFGSPYARFYLAQIFQIGLHVTPQPRQAVYWYLKTMLKAMSSDDPDEELCGFARERIVQMVASETISEAEVNEILSLINSSGDY